MRSSEGVVLFVDMLGFSALTSGVLKLGEAELAPWRVSHTGKYPHQLLAARILVEFRKVLSKTVKEFSDVKVAQLSDCAFLWSTDVKAIVNAGRFLMEDAALRGLLCRGGLASGDIHEPDRLNHALGAFVVGDAVTRAAKFEALGKGMRVFTDVDTAKRVSASCRGEKFRELVNPLNGESVDEWQWYSLKESPLGRRFIPVKELERIVGRHTMLRYSPRLAWSATTVEGRRQIACSVAAVSVPMEELSGNSKKFVFSVDGLLNAGQDRSDATQVKVRAKFVDELLSATRPKRKAG